MEPDVKVQLTYFKPSGKYYGEGELSVPDGLAMFKDESAETHFLSAIEMRTPIDGVEAHHRYANYLLVNNRPHDALDVLDKFSFDERNIYVHIAMLRQKIMHQLKLDTHRVDAEIIQLRKKNYNTHQG